MNRYQITYQRKTESGLVTIATNSGVPAGYRFINRGNSDAFVNEMPVYPGEVLDLMVGTDGQRDTTNYRIRFDTVKNADFNAMDVLIKTY